MEASYTHSCCCSATGAKEDVQLIDRLELSAGCWGDFKILLWYAQMTAIKNTEMMPAAMTTAGFTNTPRLQAESFVLIAGVMAAETELISPLRTQTAFKQHFSSYFSFLVPSSQ